MSCSRWSEWMSLRLDGLLARDQEEALLAHLAACQACQQQWEAMSWASSLLTSEPVVKPPADFTAKVERRLRQRELLRGRLMGSLKVCVGSVSIWGSAAAIALVLLTTLWTPSLRAVTLHVGFPLLANSVSMLSIVTRAGIAGARALCTTSTALLLFGYICLALALVASWTRVVALCRGKLSTRPE